MADNFAQTVKQQTDIVRIVGDYVKLRKSGANWSALCPFHKEKSGSFYLYPTTASYYCFGCHEHGDVFTFVMKMDNVSFPEAVRSVATKMGISLPQREFSSPQEAREAGLRKAAAGDSRGGDPVLSAEPSLARSGARARVHDCAGHHSRDD